MGHSHEARHSGQAGGSGEDGCLICDFDAPAFRPESGPFAKEREGPGFIS
jgi:hypothetical protein